MNIFSRYVTLMVLLFSFPTIANTSKLSEQEEFNLQHQRLHNKMVKQIKQKLKQKDKDTFEEFTFLGFSYCLDTLLSYHGSMGNVYSNGFNGQTEIFPRLIDYENLEKELSHFHNKNFKYKNFSGHFDTVNKCQNVYSIKNQKLRKVYLQIINNPKYQENWNFDY